MASDGMIMNFDLGDAPLMPKQAFQGGRWKDRTTAKRSAKRHSLKSSIAPHDREIFAEGRHERGVEEYVGPGAAARPPKRQRIEAEPAENAPRRVAVTAGKLPPGSISTGGSRSMKFQEDTRPAFVAGKLPPGSIKIGGARDNAVPAEAKAAFVSGKLPPGSISTGGSRSTKFLDQETPESVSGTLPTGSLITEPKSTKFPEESNPAFVSGKLPPGSITVSIGENPRKKTFGQAPAPGTPAPGSGSALNRDGTSGVISSLFTFNPASKTTFEDSVEESEPAKPSNAPLTEEMANFTSLGLSTRLAAHLSTKMDMKAPTAIQKAAITQMVDDDSDVLIQAETGSGKTLAYLLPIVQRIMAMSTKDVKVHRDSGLFAIILAPTRELCKQIAKVLENVLRCAPWIVGTTVIGGEGKQSEKARLRKGVNILIATPGRLADHLQNTEVLKVHTVRWLVLDEGDRLMEMGFEEEIKGIVERIRRRTLVVDKANTLELKALPSRRVTILCSATIKMVQRLGEISLEDAVHIKADPSEEDAAKNKADNTEGDDEAFSAPAQLKQAYAIVPAKLRLVTLSAILKRAFARRGSVMKAIVFISCADSVDFHFSLFSREPEVEAAAEAKGSEKEKAPKEAPTVKKTDLTKDTVALGTAFSNNTNPVVLHKLHGSLPQNIRTATLKAFMESAEPGVLICTDVASRGLDLPNVDYVIEYDPPFSADDHLHRVGRTARAGRDGRALIFLLPGVEEEYVSILASGYRDGKKALVHNTAEDLIRKGFGGTGREWEQRATDWQLDVERWTLEVPKRLEMARSGYQSHLRAYTTHVAKERHIFNFESLHLGHLAKAFGLRDKPGSIKVPGARPAKMTKADRSVAARKAKRGEVEDKVEGERVRKQRKLELDAPAIDVDSAAKRMRQKMKEHMAVASEFNIG
jgi:ATP-dependent RNA helicase DDX31/DBP7